MNIHTCVNDVILDRYIMNSTPEIHHLVERLNETRQRLRALEIAVARLETRIGVYSGIAGILSGLVIGIVLKFL